MTAHDCPAKEQLTAFALGKVGDDAAEPIAQHLETCPQCAETIDCLSDATDLVIARVKRSAEPGRFETDSECRQAIDRVKQYGHDPSFSTLSGVASGTAPPGAFPATGSMDRATGCGPFPFLAPPQSADEMGRLGAYRILKVLGKGGMGVVFQAEDPRLGRLCALKVMLPEVADRPGMKERFLREARAAAQIEHDHIIPVFQVDEERGVPYIAMPFLKGMSLEDWIRRKLKEGPGAIKVAEILKLGRQIARGLAAAHERGMIHRDIKPANVWLDASAGGRVKILDFGLARLETADQQHLTQSGAVMGTPSYMAPEQAKGEQVDGRADLFSLGVILHRLCTGELPFKGKDTISTLLALATHTPPAPHTVNPAIPQPLSDLVVKLLAKEPADRLASAKDAVAILQSLEKSLAGTDPAPGATPSMSAGLTPSQPSTERFPIITVNKAALRATSGARVTRSAKRGTPTWPRLVIAAGIGGIALLAGILIFWKTPNGTVRIEISDQIEAKFDSDGLVITKADQQPIRITPTPVPGERSLPSGDHTLTITHGKFKFQTTNFKLEAKGETVLKIDLLDGEPKVSLNDQRIGVTPLGESVPTPEARPSAVAASAGYALQFDGDDHVEVGGIGWGKLENYTFEAFASLDQFPKDVGFIVNRYKYGSLAVNTDGRWMLSFKYKDELPPGNLYDAAPAELKKRFHLAGVASGRQFRLFVDGKLVDEKTAEGKLKAVLDNRLSFGNGFSGTLDGIRISQVARYDAPFTPPARLEKDANTLVLYGFNEGTGSLLVDASGNGRQGKIVGAKWVRADGSAIDLKSQNSDSPSAAPAPAVAPFDAQQARAQQEAWATYLDVPVEIENSLGMKLRLIPPGKFLMGTSQKEADQNVAQAQAAGKPDHAIQFLREEAPQKLIAIDEPFYLGVHEVTQKAWQSVMGSNPSANQASDDLPVENNSWLDVLAFCNRMSEREGRLPSYRINGDTIDLVEADGYRAPLADEWEFACRAGSASRYFFGDDPGPLGDYAWFAENSSGRTHPVGRKRANPFGLYDMYGNVWARTHTKKTTMNKFQSARGGSFAEDELDVRSATHTRGWLLSFANERQSRSRTLGLRVLLPVSRAPASPDPLPLSSVWVKEGTTFTVIERSGEKFKARFVSKDTVERIVSGTVKDGKVTWLAKDVQVLKGGPGGDNSGTIRGDQIDIDYRYPAGSTGTLTLRRSATASSTRSPTVSPAAPPPASPAGYALRTSGEGVQADTSIISLKPWETWTVEAWVTPREPWPRGGEPVLVLMVDPVWLAFRNEANGFRWALGGPATRQVGTIFANAKFEPGKAVHVAMSRGPQGVSFFVNGVREGEPFPAGFRAGQQWMRICPPGNTKNKDVGFNGDVDEVRISSVERYPENFTPERRFEPDDKTLVLYHFDEGTGDVITDSSGNDRHGKIVGAKWVKAEGGGIREPSGRGAAKFKNALGMEFALVPKGKAWLGGGGGKPGDKEVEFNDDFYLGVYEVTQEEWQKVTGSNPSRFSQTGSGSDMIKQTAEVELQRFPVESVSWDDAQAFLKLLNDKANDVGWHYRLPSEDEWEYACRGGSIDKPDSAYDFYFKTGTTQLLPQDANFQADKGLNRTKKVGSYQPNRLGLYDLHGNVWEWCDDKIPAEDPQHPPYRAYRGGGWESTSAPYLAAARRHRDPPATRFASLGLRVARVRIQD